MSSNRSKRRRKQAGRLLLPRSSRPVIIQAVSYDATRDHNSLRNHWNYTDAQSADASLSRDVREKIMQRARYEVANNSYAFGVAQTIANNVVGSGVRMQVLEMDNDTGVRTDYAKEMEWAFDAWAQEIKLAEKLRAMRFSRVQDGESFGVLYTNKLLLNEVKLDLMPIDAERVQAPTTATNDPLNIDGIQLDEWGNPISYHVLTNHPGGTSIENADEAVDYDANWVIHWYRRTTNEQHRGVSELAACLNLFAQLRRYTESVVTAAETAADLAMVFYTDAMEDEASYSYGDQASTSSAQTDAPFAEIPFRKGMTLTMPEGWKPSQIKAEQPTTTYADFKRELLGEIGRSLQIPVNIVAGDSAKYNYASGRLDHQEFQKMIRLDQALCRSSVMTPIFRAWFDEWSLVSGHKKADDEPYPPVQWYFDGFEHVDPVKEATAQQIRLMNGSTNLMVECGKAGYDWEEILTQRAKEVEMMKQLGINVIDETNSTRKMVDTDSDGNPEP